MTNISGASALSPLFVQGIARSVAVGTGFFRIPMPALGGTLAAIENTIRHYVRRGAIEKQLTAMSDHMLEDIGLCRGDIREFANEWAKNETPAPVSTSSDLVKAVVSLPARITASFRRRALAAEMRGMSDRMLADIGIERADIDAICREWSGEVTAPAKAKIIGPKTEISSIVDTTDVTVGAAANDEVAVRKAG